MSPLTRKMLEHLQAPANHAENAAFAEALRLWRSAGCPDAPRPGADTTFGAWLAERRRERGISGTRLATALGTNHPRISRIETNASAPSAQEWIAICRELALSLEERASGEALLGAMP